MAHGMINRHLGCRPHAVGRFPWTDADHPRDRRTCGRQRSPPGKQEQYAQEYLDDGVAGRSVPALETRHRNRPDIAIARSRPRTLTTEPAPEVLVVAESACFPRARTLSSADLIGSVLIGGPRVDFSVVMSNIALAAVDPPVVVRNAAGLAIFLQYKMIKTVDENRRPLVPASAVTLGIDGRAGRSTSQRQKIIGVITPDADHRRLPGVWHPFWVLTTAGLAIASAPAPGLADHVDP